MNKQLIRLATLVFVFIFSINNIVFAQQQTDQSVMADSSNFGPRRQMITIVFCGLTGAVLGLSTLSFYGRPQEKLSNIAVGFALGVVIGTIYSTYRTAIEPYERRYGQAPLAKENNMIAINELSIRSSLFGSESSQLIKSDIPIVELHLNF